MACTPAELAADSKCLEAAFTDHQLLAALVYTLATAAGVSTVPATLAANSKCISAAFTDQQLMAISAYLQCQINGG